MIAVLSRSVVFYGAPDRETVRRRTLRRPDSLLTGSSMGEDSRISAALPHTDRVPDSLEPFLHCIVRFAGLSVQVADGISGETPWLVFKTLSCRLISATAADRRFGTEVT